MYQLPYNVTSRPSMSSARPEAQVDVLVSLEPFALSLPNKCAILCDSRSRIPGTSDGAR